MVNKKGIRKSWMSEVFVGSLWGMLVLILSLVAGCAINKSQRMDALENRNFDHALILKGRHDQIVNCFVNIEKRHIKSAIESERSFMSKLTDTPYRGGRVYSGWEVSTFSKNGHVGTRVWNRTLESMILDYRYVVDFIQISETEVRVEFYGHKYSAGWQEMGCGDVVVEINALEDASKNGDLETIQGLMDRFSDQVSTGGLQDNAGRIVLKYSAENGRTEVVQLLIDRGVDVDGGNVDDTTPLKAAAENGHLEVVKLLLSHGANVNAKNDFGNTALQKASVNGHLEIVKLLLKKGADVNAETKKGYSALMGAVLGKSPSYQGYPDIVQLLLESGAKVDTRVLEIAQKSKNIQIRELFKAR